MHLVAVHEFTYANRALKPGDRFDAPADDAAILKDGPNPRAIDDPGISDNRVQSMAMTTETAEPISPRQKRAYRRRDMRAEN